MALFGFTKKKEEPAMRPYAPVDEVARMRRQGLSNNQIVQALQRNGFQTHQIFDAFSQAELRAASPVQGVMPQGMPGAVSQRQPFPQGMQGAGNLGSPPDLPGSRSAPSIDNETSIMGPQNMSELPDFGKEGGEGGFQFSETQPSPQGGMPGQDFGAEPEGYGGGYRAGEDVSAKVEEISEAIIDEKWQDLLKDYGKLIEWKGSMEQRLAALEQRFTDLKAGFDNLQSGIIGKVGEYDQSVKDVNSEMKALEQVFQKIIPTMTENVNELSRITRGMKSSSPQKGQKPAV